MNGSRRGVIIVAVLVLVSFAAMIAGSLVFRMDADVAASVAADDQRQARQAALSGVTYLTALLQSTTDPDLWTENPNQLRHHPVDGDEDGWMFTIITPDPDEPTVLRYGVTDEASRINLNTADEQILAGFANMTPDRIAALLDFIDRDDQVRPGGAEQEYYGTLDPPYRIHNRPLRSLEELFMVRYFTGSVVTGEDVNWNFRLDPNEDDAEASFPPDNGDGVLDLGMRQWATVYSSEPNVDAEGTARIDLNNDREGLGDLNLPEETTRFVDLYRRENNVFTHVVELLEAEYELKRNHDGVNRGTIIRSGITVEQLPVVLDRLTAGRPDRPLVGLVNVNTASARVLAALPEIDDDLARRIVDARANTPGESKQTTAWLLEQGLVEVEQFKAIAPRLTTRSYQFHAYVVGHRATAGAAAMIEVVLDLSGERPRMVYYRDLTRASAGVIGKILE